MNTKLNYLDDWEKLAQEADWSVSKMAIKCAVSKRTLERFFIKKMDKTPRAWLWEQRRKQAIKLLKNGISIKETATRLGYQYPGNFTRRFQDYQTRHPLILTQM